MLCWYPIVLFDILVQTVKVLVDFICVCSLAKSKTIFVLVDEKRLRTSALQDAMTDNVNDAVTRDMSICLRQDARTEC